jgi:hypothetical protein
VTTLLEVASYNEEREREREREDGQWKEMG